MKTEFRQFSVYVTICQ